MIPPPPLDEFDFSSDFPREAGFGATFDFSDDFGVNFGAAFSFDSQFGDSSISSGSRSFQYDNVEQNLQLRRRRHRRQRQPNRCFQIKSMKKSCWYLNFTKPGMTHNLTHELSSSDCFGKIHSWFHMPLVKVEVLTSTLINRGYIVPLRSHHCRSEFQERSELLVMSVLHLLASGASFQSCKVLCNISTLEVRTFFFLFLDAIIDMKYEYVSLPQNMTELNHVFKYYKDVGLPGCVGSMDVVHVKWAHCPAGDYNRAKGKEGHPTLAFQCIIDYNCQILSFYGPQFGTRNNKDIVKMDVNVKAIQTKQIFKDSYWRYYNSEESVLFERGMYLICDNGYLRWPTFICPYAQVDKSTVEGFFSTDIKSVCKDVECTFGIMKMLWQILNNGFKYGNIKICEKIFITCCCLHNVLIDLMERNNVRVGRGYPIEDDGVWLDGHTTNLDINAMDRFLSVRFGMRRLLWVTHLCIFQEKGTIKE
jgi:hypothetical protein